MTGAYYNEIDPFKAEVLREAIKAGAIAPGEVDERSIADVRPAELVGYTQCHFFAGGGFWSLALRLAGWPDDRPCWTGSCPCPSFSAAGKGEGFDDARHLWPQWYSLIRERRPRTVFGEQVAAAIGHGWLDLVSGDMEAEGYAIATAVLGAHSAGAPHIRQRLYFGAHAESSGRGKGGVPVEHQRFDRRDQTRERSTARQGVKHSGTARHRADADGGDSSPGREQRGGKQRLLAADCGPGDGAHTERDRCEQGCASEPGREGRTAFAGDGSEPGLGVATEERGFAMCGSTPGNSGHAPLADSAGVEIDAKLAGLEGHFRDVREWRGPGWLDPLTARSVAEAGATRGFWADCDWWYGRDEKYRPIGPSLQPLAHGSPARVGRLRMYGDAICVPAAQAFIEAAMEVIG